MAALVTATGLNQSGSGNISKLYLFTLTSGDWAFIAADSGSVDMITAIRATGNIELRLVNATITAPGAFYTSAKAGLTDGDPDDMDCLSIKVHDTHKLKITSSNTASQTVAVESMVVA